MLKTISITAKSYPAAPILIALFTGFSLLSPYFFNSGNIEAMLAANSVILIASVGMTMVFLLGGIDLSISTVISASAVISGLTMAATDSIWVGAITAVSVGLGFGLVNGVLIGVFGLTPFITTMATQLIARGIAFVLSQGIAVQGTPYALMDFGFWSFAGIPAVTWVGFMVIVFSVFVMSQTDFGRHIMLIGSNRNAAKYSGIDVKKTEVWVYVLSGLLAGIAGFISISNLGNAIPGVGDTLLLLIIGAVVIGGTTMDGGEGSITKTLLGVGLLSVLTSGLNLMGIPFYDQLIVQGVLIFFGTWLAMKLSARRD